MSKNRAFPAISFGILTGLLVMLSLFNQWNYNIRPFIDNRAEIFKSISLTEYERHSSALGALFDVIKNIEKLPDDAVLYFVPVFPNDPSAKENSIWWWHLNHILRFFSYPKKVLVMHFHLYSDSREEYIKKFMGRNRVFSELDWIKKRGVTHLILYRNNRLSIVPVNTPVSL